MANLPIDPPGVLKPTPISPEGPPVTVPLRDLPVITDKLRNRLESAFVQSLYNFIFFVDEQLRVDVLPWIERDTPVRTGRLRASLEFDRTLVRTATGATINYVLRFGEEAYYARYVPFVKGLLKTGPVPPDKIGPSEVAQLLRSAGNAATASSLRYNG